MISLEKQKGRRRQYVPLLYVCQWNIWALKAQKKIYKKVAN